MPGALVLSLNKAPDATAAAPGSDMPDESGGSENTGSAGGVVHVVLPPEDLAERRLEAWLRDYSSASHVLDVYSAARVEKRRLLASPYVRLRAMKPDEAYNDVLL